MRCVPLIVMTVMFYVEFRWWRERSIFYHRRGEECIGESLRYGVVLPLSGVPL